MTTSYQDISFVLSGGVGNTNPNLSIGGEASTKQILSGLNNLFSNISPNQLGENLTDYRCFYVFNDGDSTIYDVRFWIDSEVESGSTIKLGIDEKDEIQKFNINSIPSGGYVLIKYTTPEAIIISERIDYNPDLIIWAQTIQNTLNSFVDLNGEVILGGVICEINTSGNNVIINISFKEDSSKTFHEKVIFENFLTGNPTPVLTTATVQLGSPVNAIAPLIDVPTTPPFGVTFRYPEKQSPIKIPKLRPSDGLPIWVQRNTIASADPLDNDGYTLGMSFVSVKI